MTELILIIGVFIGYVCGILVRGQEVNELKDVIQGYEDMLNIPLPALPKRHAEEDDAEFARRAACFVDALEEINKVR